METAYPFTILGTLLIVLLVLFLSIRVGRTRLATGVKAPAMTGSEEFERANRAHMNTVEQLALVLPTLWIFATQVSDLYAGIAAAIWVVSRFLYAQAYSNNPPSRATGFLIGFAVLAIMFLWSAGSLIFMGLFAIWAAWGLPVVLALTWIADRLTRRRARG